MNVEHHLQADTLAAYAAGSLPAAMALVVTCHTEVCASCRSELRRAEALGGHMLERLPLQPVSASARDAMLALLDSQPEPAAAPARPAPSAQQSAVKGGIFMPNALKNLLQADSYEQLRWRKLAPGIEKLELPLSEGRSFMLRIAEGKSMPVHTHKSSELTLIMQGGYSDALGDFNVGDIADLDGSVEHQPVAFADEPCICLAGMDGGLRFRALIPTLLKPFTRL
ncbi:putative transcriptional regulator [Litorivivens lipolytica]|uniref:Putative transcriptional regulator n=1 Tax=Litorivivens lipolytica TaxID=1524264 RepID=A0A7W4W6E2_9GAMM|nr:ChrR family anti-sigma-E factor [Litorivivens lipolytica]MBB3048292.1 putative transcriptional regulator [Litorivivens lipolytica]